MAASVGKATQGDRRSTPHRAAYITIALMLVLIVVLLPIAAFSVVADVVEQSDRRYVFGTPTFSNQQSHSYVEVDLIGLNEWDGTVTLRVSGHHVCAGCNWSDRFVFGSLLQHDRKETEAVPSSDSVTFPPTVRELTQRITLPIFGDPIRYPVDQYVLGLGIIMSRVYPDGTEQVLDPKEADSELQFSLRARIPRETMTKPEPLDPSVVRFSDNTTPYVYLYRMTFNRPVYLQILSVLLMLLVSAAGIYAVFMRPLDQLVINAGVLVLGVWGIRAILLGTVVPGITLVDLALSLIILMLLVAITLRALHFLQEPTGWWFHRLRFWRKRPEEIEAAEAKNPEEKSGGPPPDYLGPDSRTREPLPPVDAPRSESRVAAGERRAP